MKIMMKRILLLSMMLLSLLVLALLQSCDEDDDVILITRYYAYEDAEEAIAVSLSYATYGMVANMNRASNEIQGNTDCDVPFEDASTFYDETITGYISYEYAYHENYVWTCGPETTVDYTLTATQYLDAVLYDYNHEIVLDFQISGLEDESPNEVYEGTYNRTGEWESGYNEETYAFDFDSEISEALVSKESNKIYSGTATFSLVQSYSYSNITYTYKGTVEFINEDEARVEFESGEVFYVNLNNISIADTED